MRHHGRGRKDERSGVMERRIFYVTLLWKQNFCMTPNLKYHLKSEFAQFQTSLISFNFSQFVKLSGLESKRTVSKLKKEKENFGEHFVYLPHKAGA